MGALTVVAGLFAVTACGTPPANYSDTDDVEPEMVASDGAASADPTYRVRGATGLFDLGRGLF